jgi:hypothetical protein
MSEGATRMVWRAGERVGERVVMSEVWSLYVVFYVLLLL